MLPTEIENILTKYKNEVAEEISSINRSIDKITDQLNVVSAVLVDQLSSYAKHTGLKNKDKEVELLYDSQQLREYISSIKKVECNYAEIEKPEIPVPKNPIQLDIFDVVVLHNTQKCSYGNHDTMDVRVSIPVLYSTGEVHNMSVLASYCKTCNRYTILKDVFKKITGVIMCEVIDRTSTIINNNIDDEIDIEQKKSILYKYGYNVKSKLNLSSEQRHIILASVLEADIMNRRQIIDHLTILIERGSKIPKWKDATAKWKNDKDYIQNYKVEDLADVIFQKIILKYKDSKFVSK